MTFQATTPNAIIVDNCEKLTFKGVTFNLPTDTPCDYTLVVQVFGLERWFDACGNMFLDYPFISETISSELPAVFTVTLQPVSFSKPVTQS